MKRTIALLFILTALTASMLAQSASVAAPTTTKEVYRGGKITLRVVLAPAPEVNGSLQVMVTTSASVGAGAAWLSHPSVGVTAGQTEIPVVIEIPPNAALGNWQIGRVTFLTTVPAVRSRNLEVAGGPTFKVIDPPASGLPKTATVTIE